MKSTKVRKVCLSEKSENAVKPREKAHPIRAYRQTSDRCMVVAMARLEGVPKPIAMTSSVNDCGAIAVRLENWRRGQ
jgi:hypothetical protein